MTSRVLSTVEVVQVLLSRLAARDAAGIARLFAPRVDWRVPDLGGTRWSDGARNGREVESYFLALFDILELEQLTVRQVVTDGGDAVVLGWTRWRVIATGALLDMDFAMSVAVYRGEIEQYWQLQDTLAVALALGTAQMA
ncbi:hypothetical protein Lesp02_58450 [Lentzea sp. NBRC 105346]|uniref:nuclear transport factor 2 family protein n=1 Tax=Lentzea sp. NBRC 105346 TaxID=3032205 RepID=UPI0024A45B93|nr:nuclear transport factor 2 family protein [Lentzea sp. NBRC 105346]GLZ33657.1 hypothetical protein Lesp02_58450 [Lentzea sp. NBRC 105346]